MFKYNLILIDLADAKSMLGFFLRKLIQGVLMLLIVSALTFGLLSSAGGDALSGLRDNPQISEATIENLRKVYGLDRPLVERYGSWLFGAARGDLGESFSFRIPVRTLIWTRFLNTGLMALIALVMAAVTAFFFVILSIRYRSRTLTGIIETIILLTGSAPRMVVALAALAIMLQLPIATVASGEVSLSRLIIGSIVLTISLLSIFLAQLRLGVSEAMLEDFVRFARAKGLSEWTIIQRHALRAALNPFLTVSGLSLGGLLGGSVIVEAVLSWPGIGALMVTAVRARDIPLVMGIVLIASTAVWFGNVIAELLQIINDNRLRSGGMA